MALSQSQELEELFRMAMSEDLLVAWALVFQTAAFVGLPDTDAELVASTAAEVSEQNW